MAFNQSSDYHMSKPTLNLDANSEDYLRCTRLSAEEHNTLSASLGEKYDIEGKEKIAVIFSHVKYNNGRYDYREGGERDAQCLKKALEEKQFKVKLCTDYTYKKIHKELLDLSEEDHTNTGCIFIAAMTHGDADKLEAFEKAYPTDTLWNFFVGDCPTLNDKPKLIFIQACRGSKLDSGVLVRNFDKENGPDCFEGQNRTAKRMSEQDAIPSDVSEQDAEPAKELPTKTTCLVEDRSENLNLLNETTALFSVGPKQTKNHHPPMPESFLSTAEDQTAKYTAVPDAIPIHKEPPKKIAGNDFKALIDPLPDLLLMYSTTNGYVSWRHNDGSYFIQSLCTELNKNGGEKDLLQLLTDVSCRVAQFGVGDIRCKQMTCIESTLTKQLFLTS